MPSEEIQPRLDGFHTGPSPPSGSPKFANRSPTPPTAPVRTSSSPYSRNATFTYPSNKVSPRCVKRKRGVKSPSTYAHNSDAEPTRNTPTRAQTMWRFLRLPYMQQLGTNMTTGTMTWATGPARFLFYPVFARAVGEDCSPPRHMSRRILH